MVSEGVSRRLLRGRHWARRAGRSALEHFRDVETERKPNQTLVTQVDRTVEQSLRSRIEETFPDDAILGEEYGASPGRGPWRWILDPLDGTAAYATDLHVWCVSLGIWRGTDPTAGVLWVPFTREEYAGTAAGPPRKNGEVLEQQERPEWDRETLLLVPSDSHRSYGIRFPGKTRCLGSTAYHMAMVLDGRAAGAVLGRPHIWDLAGVWALAESTSLGLCSIEGKALDRARVLEGRRPKRPLVMAREDDLERLTSRISWSNSG